MQKATEPRENFLISLKFTNNGVSRFGLIALSQTLDCPSIIGKNIDMVIKTAETLKLKKEHDYTQQAKIDHTFADAMLQSEDEEENELIRKHQTLPQMNYSIHILKNIRYKDEWLKVLGVTMKELEHVYQVITSSEFYSNMVRYDGSIGSKIKSVDKNNTFTSITTETLFEHWSENLHPNTLARLKRGLDWILNGEYAKCISKMDYWRANLSKIITPDSVIYTPDILTKEDEPILCIANLLGIPRATWGAMTFFGWPGTDIQMIKRIREYWFKLFHMYENDPDWPMDCTLKYHFKNPLSESVKDSITRKRG